MSTNRLDLLKQMLTQDPSNNFVRYGLAMEYVSGGRLEEAVGEFRSLIDVKPDYAAAYYHGGQALEKLGRINEAREMYERGIEVTTRSGDAHARSELQAVLDLLP